MVINFLDWNKETWKGIFYGIEILILILAFSGFFIDIKIGKDIGEYSVSPNSQLSLGKTEDFQGKEVAAYTFNTGYFTQSCLNNVSIKSAVPSIGDINGGIFCTGQKITIEDWVIHIKGVHPEKDEAILIKTKLYLVPLWLIWIILLGLGVVHLVISKFLFKKTKIEVIFDESQTFDLVSIADFGNKEGRFVHLIVKNMCGIVAKNCYVELLDIYKKTKGKFEKIKEYRAKTRLRWANKNNGFERVNIDKKDRERSDLFFVVKGGNQLFFETDNFIPRGIQTIYPFGEYKIKVKVSGDNFKPIQKEFNIKVINYNDIKVE